ncbi:MAG: LytTR family transcriptional regulator [Cytophagaceae bacterium]|nr:LytTR family transcriptional regulator [Cytophagaceae bacterium]MBL0300789.1 LytTR family transcriptional regulator [Cytophagaceae bacterium]
METLLHLVGNKSIRCSSIILLKAEVNYSHLFLTDGRKITISKTLKELEKKFSGSGFFRPHKSFLINMAHVVSYSQHDERKIVMTNNYIAEISRRKLPVFLEEKYTKKALC